MGWWKTCEQVQGTTGYHGAKAKGCQRHCFTCMVLYNMLRTLQGGADRIHDTVALQSEQVVYMPNENHRNPLRVAKHQRDLLQDYSSIMWGH